MRGKLDELSTEWIEVGKDGGLDPEECWVSDFEERWALEEKIEGTWRREGDEVVASRSIRVRFFWKTAFR